MSSIRLTSVLRTLYLIIICDRTYAANIPSTVASVSFYGGNNEKPFQEFFGGEHEYHCNNISQTRLYNQFPITFVDTEICIIVYENFDCGETGWNVKVLPSDHFTFEKEPKSFRTCRKDDGGSQLDVFIIKYNNGLLGETEQFLETYRNVCSCINVPEYLKNMDNWTIQSNGNELVAYCEPDCQETKWKQVQIDEEIVLESKQILAHEDEVDYLKNQKYCPNKIKSFGPDLTSEYFNISCKSNENEAFVQKIVTQEFKEDLKVLRKKVETISQKLDKQKEEDINISGRVHSLQHFLDQMKFNSSPSLTNEMEDNTEFDDFKI